MFAYVRLMGKKILRALRAGAAHGHYWGWRNAGNDEQAKRVRKRP